MEMQQVRYFVALADTLNFTRAAEKCNVSQPALTRAIQQLEHELGGPLFHRERGNTHLSELGRMMFPYLQTVEEQARAAREQARAVKKLERATLTIGTMCTIGPQLVSDLMIMAFQTDTTRISTFLLAGDGNNRSYADIGIPEGHHHLSNWTRLIDEP